MARLFGTDGIRGVANVDLTPELMLALGRAAALSPDDYQTVLLLGEAQARAGRMAEARASLEFCRRIDPDGPRTRRLAETIHSLAQ